MRTLCVVFLALFLGLVHVSCSSGEPWTHCEADQDCVGVFQHLPGSTCVSGECKCPAGEVSCCLEEAAPNCMLQCAPCDKCGPLGRPEECIPAPECIPDGPLVATQRRGDCRREQAVCTDGKLLTSTIGDPFDTENDGNPCTEDICNALNPAHLLSSNGKTCEYQGKSGVCYDGRCVDCIEAWPMGVSPYGAAFCAATGKGDFCGGYCCSAVSTQDCPLPPMPQPAVCNDPGTAPWAGTCVPEHCVNESKDADETLLDCGGSCLPCP